MSIKISNVQSVQNQISLTKLRKPNQK